MILEIDFDSSEAIYIQLRNQIIRGIATDQFQDGQSLPSVRQLAQMLGVNMHTVNKAYAILREEGYLTLDRRSGAVICVEAKTKELEIEHLARNLEMVIAEAICKDVTRDDLHQVVDYMYDKYDRDEE